MEKTLFVAADGGARDTLLPVARACGGALENVSSESCTRDSHWHHAIETCSPTLLVVGTSDSHRGRSVEAAARRAARSARLPIVAIEDYPGNYNSVSTGEASLVLVESEPARELYARRLGTGAPPVEVMSPARYDDYRVRHRDLRAATARRWQEHTTPRVLWAGQPETEDSVRTLEALLPALRERAVELLFKAHPRDPGHTGGIYQEMLERSSLRHQDLTGGSIAEAFDAAPRLLVTQFSSVAIEAGFYGIPSLCLLLPDAGGERLLAKKSHAMPLICVARAAAFADHEVQVPLALARALSDEAFRSGLIDAFDQYFETSELKTLALTERLRCIAEERK